MRLSVRHETLYRYSKPVRLASHVLRLNPRTDSARILAGSLTVGPAPAERHDLTDRFGNQVTHLSFDGLSDRLHIESHFDLDIFRAVPLHDPGLPRLPWSHSAHDELADYRVFGEQDAAVQAFAAELASESGWAVLPFLNHLSQTLFTRLERRIRVGGAAQAPAQTLAIGSGACRDLTVLFMAACRSLGIAARFVSGYQAQTDTADGQRHLHAWPDVFLLGLGWRGFDPTHGIAVTDGHVALCAAPDQAGTMPVEGGFYGDNVTSTLEYHVDITTT
jgi:transglutaminase-like putative cysteine protease